MKKIAIALASLAIATPALAQDEPAPFEGAHVSAIVGYDVLDVNLPGVENPDGVAYGVALGYDIQRGSAVFGIEGEVADSTAELKAGGTTVASAARDLYVGGRIGYATGSTLIYGKVGYTNARIESVVGDDNGDGIRVGAGVEKKLGDRLFLKAEYRYSNYEADVERHQAVAGVGVRF